MSEDFAIKVENLSKNFKLPHEKQGSVKNLLVNFRRRGKGYETQQALKDVSFEIKKGDFFGIVGRNGGGKSTLLKMLAGIYSPDQGAVHVRGKLTPFIELGVGFNNDLSGRENVYLNGALLGFSRKEMNAMYQDIVDFAEIERFMDQKLKNYSSGMQVRLAFSIAIRAQSDILLLDEVLAVGDAAFQQKCFDYFKELKSQNKTVVFVTHDMSAVRRFCNRAVYIKNGKLVHDGSPQEIADFYLKENIEDAQKNSAKLKAGSGLSKEHSISFKVAKQDKNAVQLEFKYGSKDKQAMYIAISVLRDGVSIAEITTPESNKLTGNGTVTFSIDTDMLNAGVYEVTSVLCAWEDRRMLSLPPRSVNFTLTGDDITRGAALNLADTWQVKKS